MVPKIVAASVLTAVLVGGCAGRDANPVTSVRATDDLMSCEMMAYEIEANNRQVNRLMAEQERAEGRNVAIGVASVLFLPIGLLAMDLSDAERVEADALNDRNHFLATMYTRKDCGVISTTTPYDQARDAGRPSAEEREAAIEDKAGPRF